MSEEKTAVVNQDKHTYEGNDIPKTTKWVYSVSAMFRDACYALVSGFLLTYIMYSGVLGPTVDDYNAQIGVINVLFVIFLVWDGINDPLFGIILEKCHLKSGKFRPWILIGGVLNAIVVATMFSLRPTGWAFVIFWAIFYFLWDTVFTLNDIGYWSMLPSMTSDEKKRNEITTIMAVFVSLGSFGMYAVCSLLPNASNYTYIYRIIAIVCCTLFGLSQIAVFFLCKEKKRDPVQDAISAKTQFRDLFKIVAHNKPLLTSVIAILLYYTGSSMMIGFGSNYFYLTYGYGGNYGGAVQLIFTVTYALGTLISQASFGLISKKFKKQTILTWTGAIAVVAYLFFFFVGIPLFGDHPLAWNSDTTATGMGFALGGSMALIYIPSFFFFGAQGVFYLVLLMMMQNSIEYNEWKNGERKESVAFSWRPLDAKFGSAIQKGVIAATLAASGLYTITSGISSLEQNMEAQVNATTDEAAIAQIEADTTTSIDKLISGIQTNQLIGLGIGMVASVVLCLIAAWAICHFGYKLDEVTYANIVKDLDIRHKEDAAKAAASDPSSTPSAS